MRKVVLIVIFALVALALSAQDIQLGPPPAKLGVDVLDAIRLRAAARAFVRRDVPVADLSAILWAANGLKGTPDAVTAASKAGRTIPVSGDVDYIDLYLLNAKGVYRYVPESNTLKEVARGDQRARVSSEAIPNAAFMVLFTLNSARLPSFVKPGTAGARDLGMGTASYAAQNLALAAAALKLGSVVMYSFAPGTAAAAQLTRDETPLFIMQVGYIR